MDFNISPRIFHTGLLAVLFFLGGCQSSSQPEAVKTQIQPTLNGTLNNYLQQNIQANGPGAAVFAEKEGSFTYLGFRGMADTVQGFGINENTGFRIGSISKTFTAISVMQLVEKGQLNVEDKLLDHLPEFPSLWSEISIHDLLSHQSGIPDFANDRHVREQLPGVLTNAAILQYFRTHSELEFAPGSKGQYSNTGFVLLAEIVERVTGLGFIDYLNTNIFIPLNMLDTYVLKNASDIRDGFALNYGNSVKVSGEHFYAYGSSGIVSTITDMRLFADALADNQLISAESIDIMRSPNKSLPNNTHAYGYGLIVDPSGYDAFYHTGGNDGYQSLMFINREESAQIIILGNGGSNVNHGHVMDLITEFFDQSSN